MKPITIVLVNVMLIGGFAIGASIASTQEPFVVLISGLIGMLLAALVLIVGALIAIVERKARR